MAGNKKEKTDCLNEKLTSKRFSCQETKQNIFTSTQKRYSIAKLIYWRKRQRIAIL
jgi:hypothetical protein